MSESRSEAAREPVAAEILTHRTPGYWVAWALTRVFYALYFRESFEGREHLPPTGGVLILSNHQSFLDIPLLSHAVRRHVCFVARDSLAKSKPLAWLMRTCGAVLIKRGAADRAALREMQQHLERGDVVVVFPEGTRTLDGSVQEFRPGAMLAARMAKVPIVPCAIRGAFTALGRNQSVPRPTKIRVRFGAPIDSSRADALDAAHAVISEMAGDGRA